MEFWLMDTRTDGMPLDDRQIFQLPVNPGKIELVKGTISETFNTENLGEINFIGKRKLATIDISSFFPAQKYNFCNCEPKSNPYDYIDIIDEWRFFSAVIRLVITDTPINMLCSIENFTHTENAMSRDVEYTLSLKEYRDVTYKLQ